MTSVRLTSRAAPTRRARTRRSCWRVLPLVLLLLAAACGDDAAVTEPDPPADDATEPDEEATDPAEADEPADTMQIAIGASTPLLWPHVWIAEGEGLWEQHGLEAEVTQFATGGEVNSALVAGSFDVGTVSPTPTTIGGCTGVDVRVLGVAGRWADWRVQARADAGISEPEDLEGKSIALSLGTSSELAFQTFLEEYGVDSSTMEIVNVGPPDMIPSLQTGSVDAINTWQPFPFRAEQAMGDELVAFPYDHPNNYLFTAMAGAIEANPELFERFMAAMRDAHDVMVSDPQTAAEHTADPSGLEVDELVTVWEEYESVVGPADDLVLAEMEQIRDFALDAGDLDECQIDNLDEIFLEFD